ncbi:MAG: hypothetical protein JXA93_18085, partial [Anaerolineae bacterium]|nr:hypothetical protein [Anaerolineae bacterium]
YIGKAGVLYEWNDLDRAMHHVLEGIRLSEMGGFVAYQVFGHGLLARIHHAQGNLDRAMAHVEEAEQLRQGDRYALVMALVAEMRVRLWLAQGDLARASDWAQGHRLHSAAELDAAVEIEQTAVAQVLIASVRLGEHDRLGEVQSLLAWLIEMARAAGRVASTIKLLALQAIAFEAQGHAGQAMAALSRALSLAEPEGYTRTFVDEGEPVARLLQRAVVEGIAPGYAAGLRSAFPDRTRVEPTAEKTGLNHPLVEPLTPREVEVLRLIAAGLSNRDIAEELVISLSTAKSHINHLYGKLDVKNRTQAVARGRELELL